MVSIQDRAKKRAFAVNERGLRIGQDHPRAVLADDEVGLLLELRAELNPDGTHVFSLDALAKKFEVSKSCVAKICRGEHRAQVVAGYKKPKQLVNDGLVTAALRSQSALGVQHSGLVLCMDPKHSGTNVERPAAERVQLRPAVWVCVKCAEKAGRNFKRARGAGGRR